MEDSEIPDDLQQYLDKHNYPYDTRVTERPAADVPSERISKQATAFFPRRQTRLFTAVFFHIPGGFERVVQGDFSWCSNLANETSCIVITVDRDPIASDADDLENCACPQCCGKDRFDRVLSDCESQLYLVRELCAGSWKESWGTDETRIIISGSSVGSTIALILASSAEEAGKPAYGMIHLVPLIDTDPDLKAEPWGSVKYSPGLTQERLLGHLNGTFKNTEGPYDWCRNPSKWSGSRLKRMPPMCFALAKRDILCPPAIQFGLRIRAQGVSILIFSVNGIHQVKDMDGITQASRDMWEIVLFWCAGLRIPPEWRDGDFAERIPGMCSKFGQFY